MYTYDHNVICLVFETYTYSNVLFVTFVISSNVTYLRVIVDMTLSPPLTS